MKDVKKRKKDVEEVIKEKCLCKQCLCKAVCRRWDNLHCEGCIVGVRHLTREECTWDEFRCLSCQCFDCQITTEHCLRKKCIMKKWN